MTTKTPSRSQYACVPGVLSAVLLASLVASLALTGCEPDDPRVDVERHQLFISCVGAGSPAVILEAGLGDAGSAVTAGWTSVRDAVAKYTQVCVYDRAGMGHSDQGPAPRDTQAITSDLQRLLHQTGLQPPFVLVGHSVGGIHVRFYAHRFPTEVAGMVFIDPTPIDLLARDFSEPLTAEQLGDLKANGVSEGTLAELEGMHASLAEVQSAGRLLDVPLVVLTSSRAAADQAGGEVASGWQTLSDAHQAMANEVTDGVHVIATTAGHYIQIDEPRLVVDAIGQVWEKTHR